MYYRINLINYINKFNNELIRFGTYFIKIYYELIINMTYMTYMYKDFYMTLII